MILLTWLKPNFLEISRSFAQTMLKSTVIPLSLLFYEPMALFPTDLARVPLNRMGEPSVNTVIYWILLALCLSLLVVPRGFGGKLLLPRPTLLIGFHHPFLVTLLHTSVYMVLLPIIILFVFLVVPALSCYSHMSELNLSLGLVYVAFLGMGLSIKVIVVGILYLDVFESLVTLSFGNIRCFPPCLLFSYPLPLTPLSY